MKKDKIRILKMYGGVRRNYGCAEMPKLMTPS